MRGSLQRASFAPPAIGPVASALQTGTQRDAEGDAAPRHPPTQAAGGSGGTEGRMWASPSEQPAGLGGFWAARGLYPPAALSSRSNIHFPQDGDG